MELMLGITSMDEFYEMILFARKPYYNQLDFECTQTHFTLSVSRPSPQGRCFVELQLQAQFFPHYAVSTSHDNITLHRAISPQQFFISFHQMTRSGFDFVMFTLAHNRLKLSFRNFSDPPDPHDSPYDLYFPFLSTCQHLDPNRTRSTTFVGFPPFPLQCLLATLKEDSHFSFTVTLTTSKAQFTGKNHKGRYVGFCLSVEKGECEIQDVAEGEETQIAIVLDPLETFKNIMFLPNPENYWVGIGKSNNNNNRGIVIICKGLYAQYFFYSTE